MTCATHAVSWTEETVVEQGIRPIGDRQRSVTCTYQFPVLAFWMRKTSPCWSFFLSFPKHRKFWARFTTHHSRPELRHSSAYFVLFNVIISKTVGSSKLILRDCYECRRLGGEEFQSAQGGDSWCHASPNRLYRCFGKDGTIFREFKLRRKAMCTEAVVLLTLTSLICSK